VGWDETIAIAAPWITLATVALILYALIKNLAQPDLLFVAATTLFAALGIISPKEAFAGFSNSGMLTVAFLFVVAAGLRDTGLLDALGHYMLSKAKSERGLIARLALVVMPMSAFLNNTPIVAMFMPPVLSWCRRNRISPSKVLIPLSYLAILGGTCTLIGTSTNLVINGMLIDAKYAGMKLFDVAPVGIPYAMAGTLYLLTLGLRILPDRKELLEQLGEARREFLLEMSVQPGCRLIGQTVETAGLRHLPALFLLEIDRGDKLIGPVGPDELIRVNDRLVFTGVVSSIVELEKIVGLVPAADPTYEVAPRQQRNRRLCEAVISETSPLIGKTIREADFRALYGAAVVAVHRGGSRIQQKIGDIRMRPGDTLLLQTTPNFLRAHRNDRAFYLISDVEEWRPMRPDRSWMATILFVILLALMSSGIVDTVVASALVAIAMIGVGCISTSEARRSIEWQTLVTIGAAFGVGTALENSGAAAMLAELVFSSIDGYGAIVAIAAIYFCTWMITEVITNNAAAVLMFPVCLEMAKLYGRERDPMPFVMALVFAASASFMTPIGYQTNMMVYGPGGYRFTDYVRAGLPMNLILWALAVILIPMFWPV
jgi:di/tricarboxylate transporter